MTEPLFDVPDSARRAIGSRTTLRTIRQKFLISLRIHPLSISLSRGRRRFRVLALRRDAQIDARAGGPRCGSCQFFAALGDYSDWERKTRKCWFNYGERVTRGDATTVRAWWPGCVDWREAAKGTDVGRSGQPGATGAVRT